MSVVETLGPEAWGLAIGPDRALAVSGCSAVELARIYGTPLHVIDRPRLEATARSFRDTFNTACPFPVRIHYAYKCNSVPAVAAATKRAGLYAEVMSSYELHLALQLGHPGDAIVVNGPYKPESFLRDCIEAGVRYIVVDSLEELRLVNLLAADMDRTVNVLFRINPDYTPHGMNQGSATASRKGCAFGLDLAGGEADQALEETPGMSGAVCRGFHIHIGTGIDYPPDYRLALAKLHGLVERYRAKGVPVTTIDVGGGFAASTTREMTTWEMLLYQALGRLPETAKPGTRPGFQEFARAVAGGIEQLFPEKAWPEVIVEPGRSIASSSQFLLLTVHAVKDRPGAGKWLITDGGLGTVTMPTFYECHEVLLADDPQRPRTEKVTIVGPVCFAGDVVYRNKLMPAVEPGEVLALMDTGAYFTALESSFGFPRPAICVAESGRHHLVRRRETFADMTGRDKLDIQKSEGPDPEAEREGGAMPSRTEPVSLKFCINAARPDPVRDRVIEAIAREFQRRGCSQVPEPRAANFVLNPSNLSAPEPFHRHAQALFCASVAALDRSVPDVRAVAYPALVRTMSNIMVVVEDKPGRKQPEVYFTTPETGFYHYPFDPARVCDSLMPIVSARLVIHNRLSTNLPQRFWQNSPVVEQIKTYCRELDKLGVLPAPFPLREFLAPADIAHLYETFEMTGLSYGNLSAREAVTELGPATFWMSARGVNKSTLQTIGRDILLVTGYDEAAGDILVSVPPEHNPKARASVDAIEHCLIYSDYPGVGAIVHVHAWMNGVAVTSQNHPCGTMNIARSVAELLSREPDPVHAVLGLKNHGLTITGPNLADIFGRIRGRLKTEVPMFE